MSTVFSEKQIREATKRVAEQINNDYKGQQIHFLGVLKGSFIFLADLVRHIQVPCTVDFVRLSSYGGGTVSRGAVDEVTARKDPVRGRHVLVVEEIVDTGLTLSKLLADVAAERPRSLKVCTLVDKTGARRVEIPVAYRGFVLDEGFLVGYGLDLDERYRNLPEIRLWTGGGQEDP
ncbi:MAG: hypoxanthine phosphoribosyltransferase [Deferrisomatales bacterium]